MMRRIAVAACFLLLVLTMATTAFALPKPSSAYYPRGGELSLSPYKETNNTFAFRATGKLDTKVVLHINGAYVDAGNAQVTIEIFIVNKWGNWVAYGSPQFITLTNEPETFDLTFPIRPKKPFCILISSFGIRGNAVLPYQVFTK